MKTRSKTPRKANTLPKPPVRNGVLQKPADVCTEPAGKHSPISNTPEWFGQSSTLFDGAPASRSIKQAMDTPSPSAGERTRMLDRFHRIAVLERFSSDTDRSLLTGGDDKDCHILELIARYSPSLLNCKLNRIEWQHVRRNLIKFGRVQKSRRCSDAFFYTERKRQAVLRYLQRNPTIEYLMDKKRGVLPPPITVGCKVRALLYKPQYGIFVGTVVGVDEKNQNLYFVSFDKQFHGKFDQYVEDYRLAIVKENVLQDTVAIEYKLFQQILVLEKWSDEKKAILNRITKLRLAAECRRRMNDVAVASQDHDNDSQYLAAIQQLLSVDRHILRQGTFLRSMFVQSIGDSTLLDEVFPVPSNVSRIEFREVDGELYEVTDPPGLLAAEENCLTNS
ncbi:uncharacterized protein LOC131289591 isoform X2 [Anopheles ziemanni]|uniref:uncharacterized protein LOC131261157 isoform X2 n=1 Tax=Anopheles coustani TaxID=139045 RepID=UPI0026594E26|nr:uncharacterized protein LOC131261157 isoform X2 [Anopheles coustani]XP_058174865.1 uncharacterized protein LOC131289591 isoform X2 [Anopheles ziemanni]